jgi:hypothetical protein
MNQRYFLLTIPLLALLLTCCESNPTDSGQPKIITGTIVDVMTQTVPSSGGTITIDRPGDSLDGLTIKVPDGAYNDARSYHISYAPITRHEFGSKFKPLTPLITIGNGGGFAEAPITLTIPCTVPDGDFPMAFLYDQASGRIEGMPLLAYDDHSVTIYTGNFEHSTVMAAAKANGVTQGDAESGIVVSSIPERLLESYREVHSTFKPGIDDWQFVNWGSYFSPEGQCAGQTLGALWYFMQRKSRGDAQLHGRFDNDNGIDPTPKLWQDDVNAYRFCSVLQEEYWEGIASRFFSLLQKITPDQITYNAIKYAMIITGEPVYITAGGTINGKSTRHALVGYRIQDGKVYISDPNDPGDQNRSIEFVGGSFTPYKFGSKGATFPGIPFPRIEYIAKSSVIDYKHIRKYYDQLLDGTIGQSVFPDFTIEVKNDGGHFVQLTDGYRTAQRIVKLKVTSPEVLFIPGFRAFREDSSLYTMSGDEISLPVGRHRIGIHVFDKNKDPYGYVGFKWYTIEVWETPPPHEPLNLGPCTCTLSIDGKPVIVGESQFSKGIYQNPLTFQYDSDFSINAHYHGGYTTIIAHEFRGVGSYPLFATAYDTGSIIADTNGAPYNMHTWGPYNGTNQLTIADWGDWHVSGNFELTYDNPQSGEKKKAIGSFSCGR